MIQHKLDQLLTFPFTLTKFERIVGILIEDPVHEIINMILSITRWQIWKHRCKIKFECMVQNHNILIDTVLMNVSQHLRILCHNRKLANIEPIEHALDVFA